MNTQALQHALSQLLHAMQQQIAELEQAIGDVEQRLRRGAKRVQRAQQSASTGTRSGGRRSAGWTEAARAQVAARMRAYWQTWREQKALPAQGTEAPSDVETGRGKAMQPPQAARGVQVAPPPDTISPSDKRTMGGRSTAGWTPQARALAAARMRARWHGQKQANQTAGEASCD